MLVLLVIFMIITSIIEQGIEVDLPFARGKNRGFYATTYDITIDK